MPACPSGIVEPCTDDHQFARLLTCGELLLAALGAAGACGRLASAGTRAGAEPGLGAFEGLAAGTAADPLGPGATRGLGLTASGCAGAIPTAAVPVTLLTLYVVKNFLRNGSPRMTCPSGAPGVKAELQPKVGLAVIPLHTIRRWFT